MKDINKQEKILLDKLQQYIHHSYLAQFIDAPFIDEDKLFLTVALCNEAGLPNEKVESYCLTSMLIQVGLDTHEEVSTSNHLPDHKQKNQQLKILAGVYYSGLYYNLLSKIGDVEMINVLAQSIKVINEHKIEIYQGKDQSKAFFLNCLRKIEGELLRNMAQSFQLDYWEELLPEILLLKRLNGEKENSRKQKYSVIYQHLLNMVSDQEKAGTMSHETIEEKVFNLFEEYIGVTRQKIDKLLEVSIENSIIRDRIQQIINLHTNTLHQIVEEG
ncbi:heptaprenyl diphosphate synthase component 1 [Bacillus salitolerans]|uniref:Heptaprenyl diphosphate synthase component 1 n=1 Tax=Bacillus salitolerans TaxID=1437434 RepID=A0ABW4LTW8_9BACI